MNFTDLAIFLAYFKSDERFYHINPKERLNYSDCVKYCNSLDATLPAYKEKTLHSKIYFRCKKWFQKNNSIWASIIGGGVIMHHGDPKFQSSIDFLVSSKQKNGIKQIQMRP